MTSKKPIYVQLETGDDVPGIRDRLSFIRGKRVLIIWPEKGTALTRKLDLVLVQREAKRRALQIALVTHDPQVTQNAHELGISTFETIGQSESQRWKRGRTKVFIPRFHKPEHESEPEELMPVASRVRSNRRPLSRLQYILIRVVVLIILIGVVGTTLYVAAPYATVSVTLRQDVISVTTQVTAELGRQQADIENGLIPATVLKATVETVGTVDTTGIQEIEGILATGRITLTNQTDQSITVPANTIVSTRAGEPIRFKTLEDVTLLAGVGQFSEARIEALQTDNIAAGNVDSGQINTISPPFDTQVSVINVEPTSGGEARSVHIVTENDRDYLLNILRGELQTTAYTQMQANITETEHIIIETIQITETRKDWTTFSHSVGDISPTLTLNMRVVVEAIAIDERFIEQITLARLSAQIPRGKVLRTDSISYLRGGLIERDPNNRHLTLEASSSGTVSGSLNTGQLQEQLAGLPLDLAIQFINDQVDMAADFSPTISVWPDTLGQMPVLPVRINIQVNN